jgi:catechol 2,3-dioxygenase-like lactoylglutathione lyase family enzyme
MPAVSGLLETCLYVADLPRAVDFYRRLFNFPTLRGDERFHAFDVQGRSVLLLFKQGETQKPVVFDGGVIPPHDTRGEIHFAFGIFEADLPAWEKLLGEMNVPIESRVKWPLGGTSLYFRDLDKHLAELATPGIWPIY